MKPWLDTAQVADLIGGKTTEWWVRERCKDGTIPAFKVGAQWRIDEDEFKKWREAQRFEPPTNDTFEPAAPRPTAKTGQLVDLVAARSARSAAA